MSTIRIVVELEGGLVLNVFSPDWPEAEVCVVDWDALDTADLEDDGEPMSSTGPVDKWDTIDPVTRQIVDAVGSGSYLTVGQVRELTGK